MYLSYALYQTLDENGKVESFHITPDSFSHLITNKLKDVEGGAQKNEFDLGPLRFYENELGIKFSKNTYKLSPHLFQMHDKEIHFFIEHIGLPIQYETVGFYAILLPENYFGKIKTNLEFESYWLEDQNRLLLTAELKSNSNNIEISGVLNPNIHPSDDLIIDSHDVYKNKIYSLHENSVRNFLRAVNRGLGSNAPSTFICHSSLDKSMARKISISLSGRGVKVWLDEAEIKVGDSLISKIESGILSSNRLIVILSPNSVNSRWCQEELRMALHMQINGKDIKVLPALIKNCEIPGFLKEKNYADFRDEWIYETAIEDICDVLLSI